MFLCPRVHTQVWLTWLNTLAYLMILHGCDLQCMCFVVRRHSQFLSKTVKKSERCAVLKPQVSTVHLLQKDNGHETHLERRADTCSSAHLRSAPKRRKTCSAISTSRVVSLVDRPLLKSMSTLSLTANSMFSQMLYKSQSFVFTCKLIDEKSFLFEGQKCVTTSLMKQPSRPSTPERLTDKDDSIFRHPSPTDTPSPQPWESPNTIRRPKVRSYMSPTTSSRAKVMSHKEGLHLNLSSGQTSPCLGSSPTSPPRASTSPLPSLSAPLPGPCNSSESRLSLGRYAPNTTVKKARASERMSNPFSEYTHMSPPTPSKDSAALPSTFTKTGVQHRDKCYTKGRGVEPTKSEFPIRVSLKPSPCLKTSSHTPQHPLVDVETYSGTCKRPSNQGLSCFLHYSGIRFNRSICLASFNVPF